MKSSWRRRHAIVACAALVTALALASCSSSTKNAANTTPTATNASTASSSSPSSNPPTSTAASPAAVDKSADGPIKLAGLFTKTPFPFGNDVEATVKEVFNEVNASGGVNGQKIEYESGDDGGNPTKAAQLARQFVGDGAVALVGSASFVDCGTNQAYYLQSNISSISGVGVDPFCYSSPSIDSIEPSPYTQVTAMLYFASTVLKDNKLCYFQPVTPGSTGAVVAAIDKFTKITGQKLTIDDHTIPTTETSFTPELLRAKSAGCDAILYGGGDTIASATLKTAKDQGMQNVDFLYVSVSYTPNLAKTAGGLGMKVYASSGLLPYTSGDPALADWQAVAAKAKANPTEFSECGYVAAKWIVSVIKSIPGKVTRDSLTKALQAGTPFQSPLVTAPLVFGPGKSHDRDQGINVVQLKDGNWQSLQTVNLPSS